MKTGKGMLIFVFLTGAMLGAMQPALLYGSETGGGNPWDLFVYDKPFHGTKLQGPLSIYYEYNFAGGDFVYCGDEGASYMVTMYYTVRLKKQRDPTLWVFEGSSQRSKPCGICLQDIVAQGAEINNFLGDIVLGNISAIPPIFPNGVKEWHLTSIDNGQFYDRGYPPSRGFVADIVITVKPQPQ
jgi:hypothetical protein